MFKNLSFCFDGFRGLNSSVTVVKNNGGDIQYGVSGKTSFLVRLPTVRPSGLKTRRALALGIPIVTDSWIHQCIENGSVVDIRPYRVDRNVDSDVDSVDEQAVGGAAGGEVGAAEAWQDKSTFRVFLSSPFLGLESYREAVHSKCAVILEPMLHLMGQRLVIVDLSWGINEENSTDEAIKVCLQQANRSQAFCLLLADRAGTTVSSEHLTRLQEHFPWVALLDQTTTRSVTHLELECALQQGGKLATYCYPVSCDTDRDAETEVMLKKASDHFEKMQSVVGPADFADRLTSDLVAHIEKTFEKPPPLPQNHADLIWQKQQQFSRRLRRVYVPPDDSSLVNRLDQFLTYDVGQSDSPSRFLLVKGPSGSGKSALLANWAGKLRDQIQTANGQFVHLHFCAMGRAVQSLFECVQSHVEKRAGARLGFTVNDFDSFFSIVQMASDLFTSVLLVIDGADQLDQYDQLRRWASSSSSSGQARSWPFNFRCVISTVDGKTATMAGESNSSMEFIEMPDLNEHATTELIRLSLENLGKQTPSSLLRRTAAPQLRNPLFCVSLIGVLASVSRFATLDNDLDYFMGAKNVVELHERIIERQYEPYSAAAGLVLGFLWLSRDGLTLDDLKALSDSHPDQVSLVLYALGERVEQRPYGSGTLFVLIDRHLKHAIAKRFKLPGANNRSGDRALAQYFEACLVDTRASRHFADALFHWLNVGDRDALSRLLLNEGNAARHFSDNRALVWRALDCLQKNEDSFWTDLRTVVFKVSEGTGALDEKSLLLSNLAEMCTARSKSQGVRFPWLPKLLDECISLCSELYGNASLPVATLYGAMAEWHLTNRSTELASQWANRQSNIVRSISFDSSLVCKSLQLEAKACLDRGRRIDLLEEALVLVPGESSSSTAMRAELLAEAAQEYFRAGNHEKAQVMAQQCVELVRSTFGRHARQLVSPLRVLASVAKKQGNFQDAALHLDACLDIVPDDLQIQIEAGDVHRKRGNFSKALGLYDNALKSATSADQDSKRLAWRGKGLLLKKMGHYEEAANLLKRAVAAAVATKDPVENLSVTCDYADALRKLDRLGEAETLYQKCLSFLSSPVHIDLAPVHYGLAQIYKAQHHFNLAERHARQELSIASLHLSAKSSKVAFARLSLANILRKRLEVAESASRATVDAAHSLFRSAVEVLRETLGPDHIEVSDAERSMALFLYACVPGQLSTAKQLMSHAIEICEKTGNFAKHGSFLTDLAVMNAKTGAGTDAVADLFDRAQKSLQKSGVAKDSLLIAELFDGRASFCSSRGQHDEARSLAQQAIAIYLKVFGDEFHEKIKKLKKLL